MAIEDMQNDVTTMTLGDLLDYVEQLGYQRNYIVNYGEYLGTLRGAKNEVLNRFADLQSEIEALKQSNSQPIVDGADSAGSTDDDTAKNTEIS
ncbi:hypothetical protein JR311_20290 (plasmid) [Bacillus velezensis]|uniref:hypothetical protein n=1 Tax=Bacillus velezensis TaxID=492670 RepID=UPI00195D0756|nr:hypothetical protein [Bacillus velezensis]QRV11365.1 hypothetical protein JR311_20290 [Bacillus velezensis]